MVGWPYPAATLHIAMDRPFLTPIHGRHERPVKIIRE
jgi:hypothetical protein